MSEKDFISLPKRSLQNMRHREKTELGKATDIKILELLNENPDGLFLQDIADQLDVNSNYISQRSQVLQEWELLRREEKSGKHGQTKLVSQMNKRE